MRAKDVAEQDLLCRFSQARRSSYGVIGERLNVI
jgi:hypothetical protein